MTGNQQPLLSMHSGDRAVAGLFLNLGVNRKPVTSGRFLPEKLDHSAARDRVHDKDTCLMKGRSLQGAMPPCIIKNKTVNL